MTLLSCRLHGAGMDLPNRVDRRLRRHTLLHQDALRHHAGPAEAALAVHQHSAAPIKLVVYARPISGPGLLPGRIGRLNVLDRRCSQVIRRSRVAAPGKSSCR